MACMVLSRGDSEALKTPVLAALLFASAHYAVFSLVYEPGPLSGRYFWSLPLAIAGPLCLWVWQRRSLIAMLGLAALLFVNPLWRGARLVRRSAVPLAMSLPAYHG